MSAAIAAAVVVGGAAIYAGSESAGAIKDSTSASIAAQQDALKKQTALNAPYNAIGTGADGSGGAIQQYEKLLGLGPNGASDIQPTLASIPGYQFAKDEGTQTTVNQASAMGLGLSGNTLQGLDKFATGLANSTYQSAVGNARDAVTIGQNAAANTGAAVQNTGNNISNSLTNQGNTIAGIDANTIAGVTKSLSKGVDQYNTLQGLTQPLQPFTPDVPMMT